MRPRSFRLRTLLIAVGILGLVAAPGIRWLASRKEPIRIAVSRGVPRGGTLAELEAAAGPADRLAPTSDLRAVTRRDIRCDPVSNPDGWQDSDVCVAYYDEGVCWVFQFRNGRLVNYDPAVLASMPQQQPLTGVLSRY